MTKENFIEILNDIVDDVDIYTFANLEIEEGNAFFEHFENMIVTYKAKKEKGITEKGQSILDWMKANKEEYDNLFIASKIGEGIGLTGRQVSGSIRSLVDLELVKKEGKNPVMYSLVD